MISRNRRTFTLIKLLQSHVGVRRSFTARLAPVHRHRQQKSLIIVPAPQLQMKYKQMLLQSKKSSSSTEFLVEKPHYKLEDGPLSIQSRLLKIAKNEMNTLRPFLIITPVSEYLIHLYNYYSSVLSCLTCWNNQSN